MRYLTDTKRAIGMGSAKEGTKHFIDQRLSAIALIVIVPLFLIFVAPLIGEPIETIKAGFQNYWVGLIAGASLVVSGMHLVQGLQVVIEDYVHGFIGVALLVLMRIGTAFMVLAALWAIVLLSLG